MRIITFAVTAVIDIDPTEPDLDIDVEGISHSLGEELDLMLDQHIDRASLRLVRLDNSPVAVIQ